MDDLIIEARRTSPGGRFLAGSSYVVFGGVATLLPPSPSLTSYPSPAVYPALLTPASTETNSSALPIIIGGVVAGLVALLGVGALAYRCCFKKRAPKTNKVAEPESAPLQSISPQAPLSSPTTPTSSEPLARLVARPHAENQPHLDNSEDQQNSGQAIHLPEPLMLFNKTSFEDAPKFLRRGRKLVPQDSSVPLAQALTWSRDRESVKPFSSQTVLAPSDIGSSAHQSPAVQETNMKES